MFLWNHYLKAKMITSEFQDKILHNRNRQAQNALADFWRRWWDLNPRAAHHGNTISNRARYDHFDTSP